MLNDALTPVEFAGIITALNAAVLAWFTYRNKTKDTDITAEVAFRDDLVAELAGERVLRKEAEAARDEWRERYFATVEIVGELRIKVAAMGEELTKVEEELRRLRETLGNRTGDPS